MDQTDAPQIYLLTPPEFELSTFPGQLAQVLDGADIACLRLSMATRDEDRLTRAADAIREVAHKADVALVIDTHVVLAQRLGLDGVHLLDGSRSVRAARKELGAEAIVGAHCGQSSHFGMEAGEGGADYIAFGPVTGALGDGELAERDLFEWWSQMIEVPVVAEGGITADIARTLAPVVDFFAIGEEIWREDDPLQALNALTTAMR
ncbi:MAG: thiamine phosphate synthase [Pelagimonas sp.]|jgi:thiamine-phosphate pyrophosphorylase|nr:thiamine phosphate synthase [Pelagimonas sp.]